MASEVVKVRRNMFGRLSEIFGSRWDIFGNPIHDKANISRI